MRCAGENGPVEMVKTGDGAAPSAPLPRAIHLELLARARGPGRGALVTGFASERPGAPPFGTASGTLTAPNGPSGPVVLDLEIRPPPMPQAPRPKGRPPRDGRVVAARLGFAILSEVFGMKKEAARAQLAELLHYSDARPVRRILKDTARIGRIFGREHPPIELLIKADGGVLDSGGFLLHPRGARRVEDGVLVIGPPFWHWHVGMPEAEYNESDTLRVTFKPTNDHEARRRFAALLNPPVKDQKAP
jgi:hypothetical protein